MSRNYATDYVVHSYAGAPGAAACGNARKLDRVSSEVRSDVTCKRCLASLAKADREFRAKSRRFVTRGNPRSLTERLAWSEVYRRAGRESAARAIAAEEGRS